MQCIIRIVDGKPFEHPIVISNFKEAFPDIDLNAPLPEGFAWFERKLRPDIQPHEIFVDENAFYEFDGNVWTDVWRVRDKTEAEMREYVANEYNTLQQNARRFVSENNLEGAEADAWAQFIAALEQTKIDNPLELKIPHAPYKQAGGTWAFRQGYASNKITPEMIAALPPEYAHLLPPQLSA